MDIIGTRSVGFVSAFKNKVIVLSDGLVAEQGSPKELLNSGGIYAHMVHLQKISQNWGI